MLNMGNQKHVVAPLFVFYVLVSLLLFIPWKNSSGIELLCTCTCLKKEDHMRKIWFIGDFDI